MGDDEGVSALPGLELIFYLSDSVSTTAHSGITVVEVFRSCGAGNWCGSFRI